MGVDLTLINRPRDYTLCIGPETKIMHRTEDSTCISLGREIISFNFNYSKDIVEHILDEYEYRKDQHDLLSIFLFEKYKYGNKVRMNTEKMVDNIWIKMQMDIFKNNMPEVIVLDKPYHDDNSYKFKKNVRYMIRNINTPCRLMRKLGYSYYPIGVEYEDAYFTLFVIGKTDSSRGLNDIAEKLRSVFLHYIFSHGFMKEDYFEKKRFLLPNKKNRRNLNYLLRNLENQIISNKEIVDIIHKEFNDNIAVHIHLNDA